MLVGGVKENREEALEKKKKKGANTFYIESVWTAQSGISKSYSLKAEVHSLLFNNR